ncbi:MAG: creatininase family protein, partial [Alphaproteobacteria bacterium]|nr:creatininase family protein [Alphaproteobacteria bacterium]
EAARWIAVLPLAATEQHGPHLPLGTDVLIAKAYLKEVRAQLGQEPGQEPGKGIPAAFLPLQGIGISTEHRDYPGTLTLPPEIAIATWVAIGEGVARAGVKKLVLVSSHGGNNAAMTLAAQELRARHNLFVVTTAWSRLCGASALFPQPEVEYGIHGGAVETSIMLASHPEHVRLADIADYPSRARTMGANPLILSLAPPRAAAPAWQAQDLHPAGAVGDTRLASAEKGRELIEAGAQAFCQLLAEIDQVDLATLAEGVV